MYWWCLFLRYLCIQKQRTLPSFYRVKKSCEHASTAWGTIRIFGGTILFKCRAFNPGFDCRGSQTWNSCPKLEKIAKILKKWPKKLPKTWKNCLKIFKNCQKILKKLTNFLTEGDCRELAYYAKALPLFFGGTRR